VEPKSWETSKQSIVLANYRGNLIPQLSTLIHRQYLSFTKGAFSNYTYDIRVSVAESSL